MSMTAAERISAEEACELLGISRSTLERVRRDPDAEFPRALKLPGLRQHLFDRNEVQEWKARLPESPYVRTAVLTARAHSAMDGIRARERQLGAVESEPTPLDELSQAVAGIWRVTPATMFRQHVVAMANQAVAWGIKNGFLTSDECQGVFDAAMGTATGARATEIGLLNLVCALGSRCPDFAVRRLTEPTPAGDYWAQLAERKQGPFAELETPEAQGDVVGMDLNSGQIITRERDDAADSTDDAESEQ